MGPAEETGWRPRKIYIDTNASAQVPSVLPRLGFSPEIAGRRGIDRRGLGDVVISHVPLHVSVRARRADWRLPSTSQRRTARRLPSRGLPNLRLIRSSLISIVDPFPCQVGHTRDSISPGQWHPRRLSASSCNTERDSNADQVSTIIGFGLDSTNAWTAGPQLKDVKVTSAPVEVVAKVDVRALAMQVSKGDGAPETVGGCGDNFAGATCDVTVRSEDVRHHHSGPSLSGEDIADRTAVPWPRHARPAARLHTDRQCTASSCIYRWRGPAAHHHRSHRRCVDARVPNGSLLPGVLASESNPAGLRQTATAPWATPEGQSQPLTSSLSQTRLAETLAGHLAAGSTTTRGLRRDHWRPHLGEPTCRTSGQAFGQWCLERA